MLASDTEEKNNLYGFSVFVCNINALSVCGISSYRMVYAKS